MVKCLSSGYILNLLSVIVVQIKQISIKTYVIDLFVGFLCDFIYFLWGKLFYQQLYERGIRKIWLKALSSDRRVPSDRWSPVSIFGI